MAGTYKIAKKPTRGISISLFIASTMCIVVGCATAQTEYENLHDAAAETLERLGTSAISVAVFDDHRIIEWVNLGTLSIESTVAVHKDAQWHLGSCTKAMTATLIARLVDANVLRFETTIGEVFLNEIHPDHAATTVSQLLRHTAGLTGGIWQTHPDVWKAMWAGISAESREVRETAVRSILSDAPTNTVGSYTYSNAGFLVAATIVEELADESWETLMVREVFDSLGMKSAGFGAPRGSAPWPHRWEESRYVAVDPREPGADNPPSLGPAGTVHASVEDWVKFLQVFIGGGPAGYLSDTVREDLLASESSPSARANPAAGWFIVRREWAGGEALNHAGSNTMNYAVVWLAPRKRRGIVIATNGAKPETDRIVDALAGWLVTRYVAQ